MKTYKEKRKSNIEIRTCIHCGSQWQVRVKSNKKTKSGRCFCDDCLNTLTKYEKQHIWRINQGGYHEETRQCLNCGQTWTVEVKNDNQSTRIKHFCSNCNSKLTQKNKDHICRLKVDGFHEKEKAARRLSHRRNIIHNMVSNAKERATKKGLDFNLEDKDIVIPNVCPLLNVPFILGEKGNYEYTPTIDRIDNTKGYTKDNIWVITKKANSMKNSATLTELYTFCTNILRYSLNNTE